MFVYVSEFPFSDTFWCDMKKSKSLELPSEKTVKVGNTEMESFTNKIPRSASITATPLISSKLMSPISEQY